MIINISEDVLKKINSPLQLPATQSDPQIGFAIISGTVEFTTSNVHWEYADYIQSGTVESKYDGYSYSCNLTLIKGAIDLDSTNYLFVPGSRIFLYVGFGTRSPMLGALLIFAGHIDEVDWDMTSNEFSISATNSLDHCLKECTMGETLTLTGLSHDVCGAIMEIAGVPNYYATIGTYEWTYTYKPSDTCLTALEQMYPIFPKDGFGQPGFGILAAPNDRIIFGYWRDQVDPEHGGIPVENYQFGIGTQCFSRNVRLNSDKCYSQVRATGKAADGVDLEPVTVNVINFGSFKIPENKIYHADFNGYTMQEDLADWANTIALELKYQGYTQTFTGPFRPQITVGDIATMTGLTAAIPQGVITSITHHIGKDGFSTDFTIESNGIEAAVSGWTSNMKANGYNRRQNLVDTTREIAEQVAKKALDEHDPVKVENIWDEEEEEEIETTAQRNELLIEFDGRNWQDLLLLTEEE